MSNVGKKAKTALPSREAIREFIAAQPGRVGKREIARAFRISGAERIWLKSLLKEMTAAGEITRAHRKNLTPKGRLPEILVLDVVGLDDDGEALARPANWEGDDEPPRIIVTAGGRGRRAPAVGERVLARLKPHGADHYAAETIRRLASAEAIVGIFRTVGREGRVRSADRRNRHEFVVAAGDFDEVSDGDVVAANVLPGKVFGLPRAKVTARIGRVGDTRSLSLIAAHRNGIPLGFSEQALIEAQTVAKRTHGRRADLRNLPLVTIDPEDARDRDDAVFAEPDADPENPGGHHLIVAIADVAHYVRPGSELDRAARERGNSVYFPDRVAPMLPETLSTDLCSLAPGQSRPAMAVHLWIDAAGKKRGHKFERALIRTVAALNYEQVEEAHRGRPDAEAGPLLDSVIKPLYHAFAALEQAREKRHPLALNLPERKIEFDAKGRISGIRPRSHFASHRLIEEFMILANVAAAETLDACRESAVYRVHDQPTREKLADLLVFLKTLGIKLLPAARMRPANFNHILKRAEGQDHEPVIHQVVLRAQAQAIYSTDNYGHFGLNLARYVHFTSPIRRYADILIHRALISALSLGKDGLTDDERSNLAVTAEAISATERRAMAAEREALERFIAVYLADQVGATFAARVSGLTRFGIFVALAESGAEGLIAIRDLGDEFFLHDEVRHTLTGRRSGTTYRLGQNIMVRLAEADGLTGSLRFVLERSEASAGKSGGKVRTPNRGAARDAKPDTRRKSGRTQK